MTNHNPKVLDFEFTNLLTAQLVNGFYQVRIIRRLAPIIFSISSKVLSIINELKQLHLHRPTIHLLYDLHHVTSFFGTSHYRFVVMQYVHHILYHFIVVTH